MTSARVHVRELVGWGLDEYKFRTGTVDEARLAHAARLAAKGGTFQQGSAFLEQESAQLREALSPHATREDLLIEMEGLSWSLGVVDLRSLIAFQRRLSFRPGLPQVQTPLRRDWASLIALSFGAKACVDVNMIQDAVSHSLELRSDNPNLQFRLTNNPSLPLSIHTGSPFFEVACFRDRWFLRDGYHRAYALLKAGVFEMPAVIVQAETMEELGATQPWFFREEILFSDAPPRVLDFLNDEVVLEYDRPPLIKTLRITMEETLTLSTSPGEQS